MKNIKYHIALFFLFIMYSFIGYCQNNNKPFKISDSYFDSTIQKNESRVKFVFVNTKNDKVNTSVTLFYNNTLNTTNQEENGNYQLTLSPGKYKFTFIYKKNQDLPYFVQDDYIISTDSIQVDAAHRMIIRINLGDVPSEKEKDHEVVKKPVLYFYPTQKQSIHVILKPKGQLLFSYPLYNNGWSFTGEPNGNIDLNGKQYRYLFWEAATENIKNHFQPTQGFVVAQTDLLGFLEEKLEAMGLSAAEQQDFITYWYPQMADNAYSYIHFMFNQSCDNIAELRISPQPEMLFRVYMLWSELPEQTLLQPTAQDMPTLKREGFHVVEWGGVELSPSVLFPTTQR